MPEHVIDNRVFLLGLDEMYRDAMKRHESGELLDCARTVVVDLRATLGDVPIEGYYTESPELTEYFRLMRALQSRSKTSYTSAALSRLIEICSSPIFGDARDEDRLLPTGADPLTLALERVHQWSLPAIVDLTYLIADKADSISLVGLAAVSRDAVVLAALRESVVLYAAAAAMGAPREAPTFVWRVDETLARRAQRFIDEFKRLFPDSELPAADERSAARYWAAAHDNEIWGRCVRIGFDPISRRNYHWGIRSNQQHQSVVEEIWAAEVWTTEQYRQRLFAEMRAH